MDWNKPELTKKKTKILQKKTKNTKNTRIFFGDLRLHAKKSIQLENDRLVGKNSPSMNLKILKIIFDSMIQ